MVSTATVDLHLRCEGLRVCVKGQDDSAVCNGQTIPPPIVKHWVGY